MDLNIYWDGRSIAKFEGLITDSAAEGVFHTRNMSWTVQFLPVTPYFEANLVEVQFLGSNTVEVIAPMEKGSQTCPDGGILISTFKRK